MSITDIESPQLSAIRILLKPEVKKLIEVSAITLELDRDNLITDAVKDYLIRASDNESLNISSNNIIRAFYE